MKSHLTHTAILVHSVDRAAKFFKKNNFHVNPPDIFESEGTREIYVGDFEKDSSKILLVEPYGEGPYKKALQKRGAGLHHLGLDVENLVEYCRGLGQSGWLLHTYSLVSATKQKTAYLVRPGVPLMLEVREGKSKKQPPPLLKRFRLSGEKKHRKMIEAIRIENAKIELTSSKSMIFETSGGNFSLKDVMA